MYGIYDDIINAAENTLESFEEIEELLEYPEVQADKAYYLSILSKYNNLKFIKDKLSSLLTTLEEESAALGMLSDTTLEEERAVLYEDISSLKRNASKLSLALSDALGCRHVEERAYCRFRLQEGSSKLGVALYSLIKSDLLSRGAKIEDEKVELARGGYVQEISFVAQGEDVITRLIPLSGAHKVHTSQTKSEELRFAITPASKVEKIDERQLKIDVFHSSGAGGQNVNKVETAIRVTHLPTGLSVVCQDERSQLKNKRRALETIEKKLKERNEQAEKNRIEVDICAQHSKRNTPISFDALSNTLSDTRLKAFSKVPFPLTAQQFAQYINGLIAL